MYRYYIRIHKNATDLLLQSPVTQSKYHIIRMYIIVNLR